MDRGVGRIIIYNDWFIAKNRIWVEYTGDGIYLRMPLRNAKAEKSHER